MPKIMNVFGDEMEVDKLNDVYPTKEDWALLAMAQLFCPEKTWKACPHHDVCVDGNEGVWIECPSVLKFMDTSSTKH